MKTILEMISLRLFWRSYLILSEVTLGSLVCLFNSSLSHVHVSANLTQMVVQLYKGNVPCSMSLALFWREGREEASELSLLDSKARWLGRYHSSIYVDRFCKLQAHTKGTGNQRETLYLECCRAKVHFLYVAYSKRIERNICLHIVTVI